MVVTCPCESVEELEAQVNHILSRLANLSHLCEVNLRRCGELQRELDVLKRPATLKP